MAGAREGLIAAAAAELDEHGPSGLSLRATARRAGVSHAAPKHHFGDRAGLLTALAVQGFHDLADVLDAARAGDPDHPVAAMGMAYVDFGLARPALFDLMFRPAELRADDDALLAAQRRSLASLRATVGDDGDGELGDLATISWALVHGLVVLIRDGALMTSADDAGPERVQDRAQVRARARRLARTFASIAAGAGPDSPEATG